MKRRLALGLTAGLAAAVAAGCLSFDIRRYPDPENAVASFVLCRAVDAAGDVLKPGPETAEFGKDDARVLAFAGVRNVAGPIRLRWKWYDPAKSLARDTGDVEVNAEGRNLEIVTAYDALDLEAGKAAPGAWTVLLLLDGRLAARRAFSVSGDESCSPRGSGT
jgi:hypothetical protein